MLRFPQRGKVFFSGLREELTAFAERHFSLQKLEKNGDSPQSYRELLEGLLKQAERKRDAKRIDRLEAELACPPIPPCLSYLWGIFCRLSNRRGSGFGGALPLSWSDIRYFCILTGTRLMPWEVEIIEELDTFYLSEPKPMEREPPPDRPSEAQPKADIEVSNPQKPRRRKGRQ